MDEFEKRVNKIEETITDLKTTSRKASTILATTAATTTVVTQIKGITFPGGSKSAVPSIAGIIEVTLDEPGFVTFDLITEAGDRRLGLEYRGGANSHPEAKVQVLYPSLADVQELDGSGTKDISIQIRTVATTTFTITTRQEPI